jgi:hypothetical protein
VAGSEHYGTGLVSGYVNDVRFFVGLLFSALVVADTGVVSDISIKSHMLAFPTMASRMLTHHSRNRLVRYKPLA